MIQKRTLFLIDDDIDEHELFEEALREVSDHVNLITATNGMEALVKLSDRNFSRPDIIFLDLNMPKMNGIQFLEKIKDTQALSTIPVYIYTTSSDPDHKEKALSLSATSFFTKPNNLIELSNTIRRVALAS